MRVYVVNSKKILLYVIMIVCFALLVVAGKNAVVGVFNNANEKLLPIYSVDKGEEKICSISFDAAWDDLDTDKLIEILGKHNVKATFFVVGSWVEKYPQSVKKFADNGHEIMNHSDTHPHINQLSADKIKEEISKCDDKIEAITGRRPNLFRGPYGEYNNTVINAAAEVGHKVVQWDVDTFETKHT